MAVSIIFIFVGERPYQCHCGASFKDSGNFCNHKKIHDPSQPKRSRKKSESSAKRPKAKKRRKSVTSHDDVTTKTSTPLQHILPRTLLTNQTKCNDHVCTINTIASPHHDNNVVTLTINDPKVLGLLHDAAAANNNIIQVALMDDATMNLLNSNGKLTEVNLPVQPSDVAMNIGITEANL